MPMFKLLITNSTLMVQGGSIEQLKQLEAICDDYLERIRIVKGKSPKKPMKRLSEIRLPSPDDDNVIMCIAGIMTKASPIAGGKPSYFPHEIKYNTISKDFMWKAQGDDLNYKDKLRRARTINVTERILEIEMITNKKTIQFPDNNIFMQWSSKLGANLTRTMTHK